MPHPLSSPLVGGMLLLCLAWQARQDGFATLQSLFASLRYSVLLLRSMVIIEEGKQQQNAILVFAATVVVVGTYG